MNNSQSSILNSQFLSYVLDENTPTYGNKNKFEIIQKSSIKRGDVANDSFISTTTHIGTHLDMPYHFYENGQTIENFNADFFVFKEDEIIFIEWKMENGEWIIKDELINELEKIILNSQLSILHYKLLIVKTGICNIRDKKEFWEKNYGFHPDIAKYLRDNFPNIKIFGFDSISVSSWQDRIMGREAHKEFLNPDNPILLLEDMNLCNVDKNSIFKEIIISPMRIKNSDGIPCSIIAKTYKKYPKFSILNSQFSIILWDFDGVILDSMKVKGEGFRELFKEYDKELVGKLLEYHYENGGISRFDKIKYFYNELLNQNIINEEINKLALKFGKIIEKKLFDKKNLIKETFEFIKANYKNYKFHIVSGAEHNELNRLCEFLELDKYFITIEGSPTKKEILIKNLIEQYNYDKKNIILIGDSINDYKAAKQNNIKFFPYNNDNLEIEFKKGNIV